MQSFNDQSPPNISNRQLLCEHGLVLLPVSEADKPLCHRASSLGGNASRVPGIDQNWCEGPTWACDPSRACAAELSGLEAPLMSSEDSLPTVKRKFMRCVVSSRQ